VSSNDIVDETCYELIKKFLSENSTDSALVGYKVEKYFPGGYLTVSDGLITSIVEKPGEGNEPSDLVNIVMHLHRDASKFFDALKKVSSDRDDQYEVALDSLFSGGVKYHALQYSGFWQPIKYPWHVLKAKDFFLSRIKKSISSSAVIADTAVIHGEVIIADNVKIFDHAVIQGPAYIGKGSVVATSALVRDSIIGERCVVGFTTEVARSYLADDVWTHKNYIGDSIIDSNCSFGSGTVTGNLRLDESEISVNIKDQKVATGETKLGLICGSGVRCGINTSFMPGIKIGTDSFVGAGITIGTDIADASYVTGDWSLKTKPNVKQAASRNEQMMKLKKS
jgi:bifunctional UDP-N-acetylglucosamine pyrophosphorylase/glucosamine-1-phosphate N-acetyltransferase